MQKKNKKLFLIDGNSFCYRAYYAIRNLSNSKGQPTNAVYGFVTMMNKIIKEENPDFFGIAFDLKGPTFRHKRYEEYKIHRKPMPEDLIGQIPLIKDIIRAYNIPIYEMEGYEADDVLATIAKKAEKKTIETFIVTGDKDALQLVSPYIKIYNTHKDGIIYDADAVQGKYGITSDKILDLMALMGDSSDNIPGVPGIGEHGAKELIKEFGTLENLLKNLDKIKSQAKRKLIESNVEKARLSKELATMDEDVPIKIDFDDLKIKKANKNKLIDIFKELEFKALLKDLVPTDSLKGKYDLIGDKKKLDSIIETLKNQNELVFDFETTHYDPMLAGPVGISFCWKKKEAYYIPFNLNKELGAERVLSCMKDIFQNKDIRKIGQNIKYDYIILKKMGIDVNNIYFDTMVASYLINPSKMNHNLGEISIEYLNHRMTSIQELIGKGKKAITMDQVDVKRVADYSCEDSDVTFRLKNILLDRLKEKDLEELFFDVEMPLCEVLASMEISGVSIDKGYLNALSDVMQKKLDKYQKEIYKLAKAEFNINSPKQLQEVLFQKQKMPVIKKTKTGPSTDESVLKILSQRYELPLKILRYREYSKLKSTYVDALPRLINPATGRIHTSFNQTVTQTGRLSSSNPNLQNIPIRTEEGKKIRKAFIPLSKDYVLLSADYSQIELRILAHLSNDKNLITAFKQDRDIHRFTASLIYGVSEGDVTDKMRNSAKTVNFGIIYGMSPFGLSKDLNLDVEKAKEFIDNYFERYPDVKIYLEDKIREARKKRYVKTLMNRRRYIPEITSENMGIRNFAERTAINAPIQGSAADIIKIAMINIHKRIKDMKSRMILQVHDELVFEVAADEFEEIKTIVKDGMENVIRMKIPLKVNLRKGKNWLDLEEVKI